MTEVERVAEEHPAYLRHALHRAARWLRSGRVDTPPGHIQEKLRLALGAAALKKEVGDA